MFPLRQEERSPPGSSVHEILQARILEWVANPSPGVFPTQGLNPGLLHHRQILYHLSHREALGVDTYICKHIQVVDQIANIRWIIEKARESQKNIYFCFTDYAKAFDCTVENS